MIIYTSPGIWKFTDELTLDRCLSENLLPRYCESRLEGTLTIRGDLLSGELSVDGRSPTGAAFGTYAQGEFTLNDAGWEFTGTDPDSDLIGNGYSWFHAFAMDRGSWSYHHGAEITDSYRELGATDWYSDWLGQEDGWTLESRESTLVPLGNTGREIWRTETKVLYPAPGDAEELVTVPEPAGYALLAIGLAAVVTARLARRLSTATPMPGGSRASGLAPVRG